MLFIILTEHRLVSRYQTNDENGVTPLKKGNNNYFLSET